VTSPDATLQELVAQLRRTIAEARSMPMSASAVVNRAELLSLIDELETAARHELAGAAAVLSAKDDVVGQGHREAEEVVAEARDQQMRLASDTEVLQHAREQADAELAAARREADALRQEVDEYVDTKLAGFEVALERSLETVRRGRERLASGDGTAATGLGESAAGDEINLPDHLQG
jgi:cell division septum initiation protein DivIVA